ncbi:MAG: sulfatase, partial [bacterium]
MSTDVSTFESPASGDSVIAAPWPWWAVFVPWISLWLMELPLMCWSWGFTMSRYGALGPLLPLGVFLALGVIAAVTGLAAWGVIRLVRKSTASAAAWLFGWSAVWAWGGLALGLWCYIVVLQSPLPNDTSAVIATVLGLVIAGIVLRVVLKVGLARWTPIKLCLVLLAVSLVGSLAVNIKRTPWSGAARGPNVLLVTIDTCNVSHLSTYGYDLETTPNLTRIASEGLRFNQAYTHVALTGPSHCSIFTGLLPQAFGVFDNLNVLSQRFDTLAEKFRRSGYFTAGHPGNLIMRPRYCYQQGFERYPQRNGNYGIKSLPWWQSLPMRYLRVVWGRQTDFTDMVHDADLQTANTLADVDLAGNRSWFMWCHYFDAHAPYEAKPEDYLQPIETPDLNLKKIGTNEGLFDVSYLGLQPLYGECFMQEHKVKPVVVSKGEVRDLIRTYDAQLHHIDHALGELWEGLKARGELDNTIVIITADHGEALFSRGYFGHSYFLYQDEMHIPLIVWYPGQVKPGVTDSLAGLTDIAPTLTGLTGIGPLKDWAANKQWTGQSLEPILTDASHAGRSTVYLERFDNSRAVVTSDHEKLIYRALIGDAPNAVRPYVG